jgi:hypothetical protein
MDQSESEFQSQVIAEAKRQGWRVYHVYDSRNTSDIGFPDLILGHPIQSRIVVIELKRKGEKPTEAQQLWLTIFEHAGYETHVWRPSDWDSGEIARVLIGVGKRHIRRRLDIAPFPERMTAEEFREALRVGRIER